VNESEREREGEKKEKLSRKNKKGEQGKIIEKEKSFVENWKIFQFSSQRDKKKLS
jgi:hypothetical protein